MYFRRCVLLLFFWASLISSEAVCASEPIITIGIVHYVKPAKNSPIVEPTLQAIREKLGDRYQIRTIDFQREHLEKAVKDGSVDIFLSSAGFYRRLIRDGARDLATAISPMYPDPNHSDGAAIVVLNSRQDLRNIPDLKGKSLVVTSKNAFSSYHVPLGEIAARGYDPFKFFSSIKDTQEGVDSAEALNALKNREVDVAFLKHCTLEDYLTLHPAEKGLYRVIEPKNSVGECARSTDLYPTWTLASTKSASPEVSRLVTSAVVDMPKTKEGFVWGVSTDFSQTDELLKTLKIGPYEYLREWTVKRFVHEYWPFIMLAAFGLFGVFFHWRRAEHLVKKRTAQLRKSISERIQLEEKAKDANHRLETLQRIGVVNQLSAIFAHEMRQPLGAISLYLEGLRTMILEGGSKKESLIQVIDLIEQQNSRADEIVQKVRTYRKGKPTRDKEIDLSLILKKAADTITLSNEAAATKLVCSVKEGVKVKGDPLEIELLVVNLIKNALEAVEGKEAGKVQVDLKTEGSVNQIIVSDNGDIQCEDDLKRLTGSFETTKKDGLGIGLSIVRGIAERHRGRIEFKVRNPHGLRVIVNIPKENENEEKNPRC